jgi:hypothetical protein
MHEEIDLELFCDNTYSVYKHLQLIRQNLQKKRDKGVYDSALAVKGFMHAVNRGAKDYCGEFDFSYPWHKVFDITVRRNVAQEYVRRFEAEEDV